MSLELKPSESLMSLMHEAATTLTNFGKLWNDIKEMGNSEGFTDKELQEMLRPLLKQIGQTKAQIYYLFNTEEQKERVARHKIMPVNHKNVLEEDYPTVELDTQPIGEKISQAVDVVNENLELKESNARLIKELAKEREALSKVSVFTADQEETNFNKLFDMLPNDDIDTFKNKGGNLMLFERLLVNFKYQKIKNLQWWVRVIK